MWKLSAHRQRKKDAAGFPGHVVQGQPPGPRHSLKISAPNKDGRHQGRSPRMDLTKSSNSRLQSSASEGPQDSGLIPEAMGSIVAFPWSCHPPSPPPGLSFHPGQDGPFPGPLSPERGWRASSKSHEGRWLPQYHLTSMSNLQEICRPLL